jgi:hypothetical protein
MSLLSSFGGMAETLIAPPPTLFGFLEADHAELGRDRNRGKGRVFSDATATTPTKPIVFEASAEQVAEYRAQLADNLSQWHAAEDRDALTACFICPV